MENCKAISTPLMPNVKLCKNDGEALVDESIYKSLVGCLLYLTTTRPDIIYSVSLLSRFMHSTSELHFRSAKQIFRYIKGSFNLGVTFLVNNTN